MRKQIQDKLIKFATRVPVFMYLTDYRERSLKDIITQINDDVENRYFKNPKLYEKEYKEIMRLKKIYQQIDNELYNTLCKLKSFNNIFTENIIKAIDNIISGKSTPERYNEYFMKLPSEIDNYIIEPKIYFIEK